MSWVLGMAAVFLAVIVIAVALGRTGSPGIVLRLCLLLFYAAVVAAMGYTLFVLGDYLAEEHARLRPWQVVAVWTGDVAAFLWFTKFCFVHGVLGAGPRSATATGPSLRRPRNIALVVFASSLALDLVVSAVAAREEWVGFQRSVAGVARVDRIRTKQWQDPKGPNRAYTALYRFRDARGVLHRGALRLGDRARLRGVESKLPWNVLDKIQKGAAPFDIDIRYDPNWPARSWPVALDWHGDGYYLHWMSLEMLFFQTVLLLLAVGGVWAFRDNMEKPGPGTDVHEIVPLVVELWMFAVFASVYA